MNFTKETIKDAFFKQAKTCLGSSLLYHDMINIFAYEAKVIDFTDELLQKRDFTNIAEVILSIMAFFHYNTLKNSSDFNRLKSFFLTHGGAYTSNDLSQMKNTLIELWENQKENLQKWVLSTKLQTNEIARCNAIYPALLSLNKEKVNLIELGCSAGLILLMDLYSYEYFNDKSIFLEEKYEPLLKCKSGDISKISNLFQNKMNIVRRIGLDLFPLDLSEKENVLNLKSTLWDNPERNMRLEQAIALFLEMKDNLNLSLLQADYTQDLVTLLNKLLVSDADVVFYSSVSTYQIPVESYHKLITRLNELAEFLKKDIYFIEFESLRDKNEQKNVTKEEPFHLTIHTYPGNTSYEFGRAHFHGNLLTIF